MTQPPASAVMREPLSRAPVVQLVDAQGKDVATAGVAIDVLVAGGPGALSGSTRRATDAMGRASYPGLAFTGQAAGQRRLVFGAPGIAAATSSTIVVVAGPAAAVEAVSSQDQEAEAFAAVSDPPAVVVVDADGNSVQGARVDFAVVQGGGSLSGTPAYTNSSGIARATAWTLGGVGPQKVEAIVGALPRATFTATATEPVPAPDGYTITLQYLTPPTAAQRAAFEAAKARIERVVRGKLPDWNVSGRKCGDTLLSGVVDDLLVLVDLSAIDGPGKVLGQAGPCLVRPVTGQDGVQRLLPVAGQMKFDSADLAAMESSGSLNAVILHEMMHVLGLGTLWSGLLSGSGTGDPVFTGAHAVNAFLDFNGGSAWPGTPVPVENTGGSGTVNAHWRETVFQHELMTGWISGRAQPLSATTIGSLRDIGYEVDASGAEPFTIAGASAGTSLLMLEEPAPVFDLTNDHLPPPELIPAGEEAR